MKIRELTDFFTTKQNNFPKHLAAFNNHHQQSSENQRNFTLINKPEAFFPATTANLLKFIICEKLAALDKTIQSRIIVQFTKRTRLKQQKSKAKFNQLPTITKEEYEQFGTKILQWLQTEFTTSDLNKIIIDRIPDYKTKQQVNLRITFYHQNHPHDLNLKVSPKINNLKKVKLNDLIQRLQAITGLELNFDSQSTEPNEALQQLATTLNDLNNKQIVHRLFKCLIGFKPYYLLIAEPNPLIADFTKHELPNQLQAHYQQGQLTTHFDNSYHLTAEITREEAVPYLEIDFQTLPNELELLSF